MECVQRINVKDQDGNPLNGYCYFTPHLDNKQEFRDGSFTFKAEENTNVTVKVIPHDMYSKSKSFKACLGDVTFIFDPVEEKKKNTLIILIALAVLWMILG